MYSTYTTISISTSLIYYLQYVNNTFVMRHLTHSSRRLFSQNIILNYRDLKSGKHLEDAIEKAYGPKGKPFNY